MTDPWTDGDRYDGYIGRWSRLVAATFVEDLRVAPRRRWVDVGCGTGSLSVEILAGSDPSTVLGIDPSAAFVAWARSHVDDPRVEFRVGQATDLASRIADVVVSGLVLNFVPDAPAAVATMRAAAPDGVIAAYVWDYAAGMQLLRHFWDAAVALDPAAASLDEGRRFPICEPEPLEALWRAAGLAQVTTWAIEVPTVFPDFSSCWIPFLGAQGPAPRYVTSLDEAHRDALRDRLRAQLPVAADGSISLLARAWAVRGE